MAFGTSSKIFSSYIRDVINNTTAMNGASDTWNVALYGNSGTPNQADTSANCAYNAGQWVSGNEVTATGWTAGGLNLASVTSTFTTNVFTFTAANKSGGATDTVTNAYGCLILDNTISTPVAKQAACYLAFGGANSVTSGTFTVAFNASGIYTITL